MFDRPDYRSCRRRVTDLPLMLKVDGEFFLLSLIPLGLKACYLKGDRPPLRRAGDKFSRASSCRWRGSMLLMGLLLI